MTHLGETPTYSGNSRCSLRSERPDASASWVKRTRYFVARCDGTLRTYRISQVLNLTPLNSPDGRERARDLMSQEVTHAQSSFLSLGAEVEVVEPENLRAAMARIAAGLGRLYAVGGGSAA
jgi:predicted DNA-binding transcriptional regulator YafY